jgi:hypothetical protein
MWEFFAIVDKAAGEPHCGWSWRVVDDEAGVTIAEAATPFTVLWACIEDAIKHGYPTLEPGKRTDMTEKLQKRRPRGAKVRYSRVVSA